VKAEEEDVPELTEKRQMMKTPQLIMAVTVIMAIAVASTAQAGSTFYSTNTSYLKAGDSPFSGSSMTLENFEDGLLNVAGVKANQGKIKNSASSTDSVDKDDGNVDGKGKLGHSWQSKSSKKITFQFTSSNKPTFAGLVWTDGKKNSTVTFRAWDKNGALIGKIKMKLGDLSRKGTTAEDRFFGLVSDKGISKIQISSNYAGFEVDHLQFGYGLAVVPVPAPIALGAVGLLSAGLLRKRILKRLHA
jgi:hypothetical protein